MNMELLAPVGDLKSFYAAVYNGADAIYLGLQNFNARIKADNFTIDNIKQIVDFAHIYNVKVYVTVNILIQDDEVNAFLETIRACVRAHVDAYIIQDLGMAKLLLDNFQNIVLHASTQMGIHNLSGAKFLEQLGFKRVVLARETKLDDIKLIKDNTNLEIEYFAQGALCVAFSGNCYLSSLKNGNSGNRGKCLQLCRLPYKIYDDSKLLAEGYYLSAKDLCLMKHLQELLAAGVDCFKLEGRLKRASYVAQVTRSYRQALDSFDALNISKEKSKISELFSRGEFNEDAYLKHNFNIINSRNSNHKGKKIGQVVAATKFKNIYKITLQLSETIGQNDAIRLVQGKNQLSIGVGNVNVLSNGFVEIFSTQNVPAGYEVFLLKSEAKERILQDFVKYLTIDFYFVAREGRPAELVANYGDVSVSVISDKLLAKARTACITQEQVRKQLSKLNGTKFQLNHLECVLDNVFMPVSELNELRRKAIIELEKVILQKYNSTMLAVVEVGQISRPEINATKKNFYLISNDSDLRNVNLEGFGIIISPAEYSAEYINHLVVNLIESGINKDDIYLNLPIVSTETEIEVIDKILQQQKIGLIANNYAHLRWIKQYTIIAGIGLNVYNQYTAQVLLNLGCANIIWSLEKDKVFNCGSALVSGYPALMTLCHCPIREIYNSDCAKCHYHSKLIYQDEKNNRYGIRRIKIKHCYFELCSAEKYEKITGAGKIYDLRESLWKSMK